MRGLPALLLTLFAGLAAAHAADDRLVPAAGTTFTFRIVSVTKMADRTITVGQVDRYVIASSDGTVAEGTIKPLALIYGCGGETGTGRDCAAALKAPGAKRDGDLVTVPVPSEIGDSLAKQSALKYRYFIAEQRKIAMPGAKDPKAADAGEFGPDPAFTLSLGLQCDAAALQNFLPFGHLADLTIPCKQTLVRQPGPGNAMPPVDTAFDMSVELTDNGTGRVTVPFGDVDVRKLALKETRAGAAQAMVTGDIAFSTRLGIAVKTHSTITTASPSHVVVVDTDSELIAATP